MALTFATYHSLPWLLLGVGLWLLQGCESEPASHSRQTAASANTVQTKPATAASPSQSSSPQADAVPVTIAHVRREPMASYVQGSTTLESAETVQVLAEAAGLLTKLSGEEGDRVQRGQILAQLDDREAQLALENARVQLAEAEMAYTSLVRLDRQEAELALRIAELAAQEARTNYHRTVQMARKGLLSQQEVDTSLTQQETAELALQQARVRLQYKTLDDARFRYERAKTALHEAELHLQYTTVKAPITGVISQRLMARGQVVGKNQHLFTIVDTSRMLARTFLPEKLSSSLKVGQTAHVEVEALPKRRFAGRVKLISPVVEAESGTLKVTVELIRPPPELKPGMFASVFITMANRANALVIPKRALLLDSAVPTVYRLQEKRAYRVSLSLGLTDNERIEVTSGLSDGDQVVVIGQDHLVDGAAVRVVADDQPERPLQQALRPRRQG